MCLSSAYFRILVFSMFSKRRSFARLEGRVGAEGNALYSCGCRRISLTTLYVVPILTAFSTCTARLCGCLAASFRCACIIRSGFASHCSSNETLVTKLRFRSTRRARGTVLLQRGISCVLSAGFYIVQCAASGIREVDPPARSVATGRACGTALRRRRHSLCDFTRFVRRLSTQHISCIPRVNLLAPLQDRNGYLGRCSCGVVDAFHEAA